jgi:hypothetical protein|tara:strand:- start:587 stop:793 length:207 start_codon:yes stop_codon:yes gene_type:complete
MKKDTYEQELKKDINIIKKDLRAISIKTRIIARELEIEDDNKKTKPKNKQLPWWIKLVITVKGWLGKK